MQVGAPAGAGTLTAMRMAVGFGWLGIVLMAPVQVVLARVERRRGATTTAASGERALAGQRAPRSARDDTWGGVADICPALPEAARDAGISGGGLSWTATVRRGMAVSLVALPRFVIAGDVPGFVVASFWLTLLLACGFVYVEPALGRRASWYWWGALVLVAPWGLGLLSAHWPPFA